jgi:hypothetical protein
MAFKAVTLNNADPMNRPLTSRTDAQLILFVERFKPSGQTRLAFCKDSGIDSKTFAEWLKRCCIWLSVVNFLIWLGSCYGDMHKKCHITLAERIGVKVP